MCVVNNLLKDDINTGVILREKEKEE